MEGLQPYPEYKDSGVPWLGEIPSHWEILRSGLLFREVVDTGHQDLELLSIDRFKGIIKQHETGRKERASEDRSIYKRIKKGELGYNLMNAFMGSVGISPHDGILSPAYAVGRPQKPMNPLFYHYLYRTPIYTGEFDCCSYGIMYERNRLYYERFKPIPAPYPSLIEQDEIVRTIQYFELLIKDYITKKRKTIDLLNEQKQAIIHQAVTRGLDPSVPMKPSGIEWLGEIPENWEIRRLKFISKITYGISPHESTYNSEGIGSILINGPDEYSKEEFGITRSLKWTVAPVKFASKGALLFCLRGSTTGRLNICHDNVSIGRGVAAFEPYENPIFFQYFMMALKENLKESFRGSTFPSVTSKELNNYWITKPSNAEQAGIAETLHKKCISIIRMVSLIESDIKLMNEYRTRLITDIVTGKLDVRSIAATLPDIDDITLEETGEEEPEEEFTDEEE